MSKRGWRENRDRVIYVERDRAEAAKGRQKTGAPVSVQQFYRAYDYFCVCGAYDVADSVKSISRRRGQQKADVYDFCTDAGRMRSIYGLRSRAVLSVQIQADRCVDGSWGFQKTAAARADAGGFAA